MGADAITLVGALVETGNIDTVYRDLYLRRAQTLLSPVISVEDFHGIEQQQAMLTELPLAVARALDKGDWPQVKELSQRTDALKHAVTNEAKRFEIARSVYVVGDPKLDPFCRSLQTFTRVSASELPALRARVVEQLTLLEQSDLPWRDFYTARRTVFQTRAPIGVDSAPGRGPVGTSVDGIREAAAEALKAGDMKRLAELADLMPTVKAGATGVTQSKQPATSGTAQTPQQASRDLVGSWSTDVLAHARQLGLAARHPEARADLTSLRQYAWSPSSDESRHSNVKQVALPSGSPEGLRDRLEVLMIHPLANSGGARHLPALVAEDVLVEDFPDPKDGEQPASSPLLTTLELPRRRGLTREAIERALLTHGTRVLEKDLGLDPRVFSLVCIPSDVHLRLGEAEGWGRQPCWTHFDGYLIRTVEGRMRLQALVGGDVRYGGLYDLLGVSRDYDSDRLVARFAVVHRERMVAW
jgi:hypothetical protein